MIESTVRAKVTSKGLCQGEGGGGALGAVLVDEDSEEDAFLEVRSWKSGHGAIAAADRAEPPLERVGGAHGLALLKARIAKAGEEVVEIGAPTGAGPRIAVLPASSEAARGGPGRRQGRGRS
jgi:hypothetical protein